MKNKFFHSASMCLHCDTNIALCTKSSAEMRNFIMMEYDVFKAVVKENFLRCLPEKYRDAEIRIHQAKKVNRTLDGLTVLPEGNVQVFPTIYINDMYEHYRACGDLETVLQGAAQKYAQAAEMAKARHREEDMDAKMEHFRENVVMCLINTEQNRELLVDVPNRQFHDLSVVYRWVVEETPDAVGSIIVSDKVAEMAGMTEEELFRCASKNTREKNPVRITSMQEIMFNVLSIPPEMRDMFGQEPTPADNMWIIGNERGINGAASMLYEENLHQLAEKLGDDLFILPSSIHEVIAVPAEMAEKNLTNLLKMVEEVNMGSLKLEERLSNSVYHYDRNARKVTLAAESPEKRLDGKTAELPLISENEKKR